MKPILVSFICRERRGTAYRTVREVTATREVVWHLMEKLDPLTAPSKDLRLLDDPRIRILLIDDVGVIIQGPLLSWRGWPDVHIGFWDKILVGREEMCYVVGSILAEDAKVDGLWTAIPKEARATLAFAKRVGFEVTHESAGAYGLELLYSR